MRHDAVIIRKSSDPQEEQSQIEGIKTYLDRKHITIPADYWFIDTGSRHKSEQREGFQRLLNLVKQDRIGRVFCWMQDRIGTTDPDEWGHFRWTFRCHGAQIIEAYSDRDLTAPDMATQITTLVAADASKQKQFDISRDTMRGKVSLAKQGMPLSKFPPYGYDKKYLDSRGGHLWTSHLLDSLRWLVANPDGSSVEREVNPKKSKTDRIVYVLCQDKERIKLVREVFDTFANESVTERTIANRLNQSGRLHYGKPWIRTTILEMLRNPAYIGHVRFNHKSQAEFTRYNGEQHVEVENPGRKGKKKTKLGVPIIVEDCHPAIIDRQTWDRVQKKMATRKTRPQPPRRDDTWLRGVLTCAKCNTPMHATSMKGIPGYICGSYYRFNQTRSKLDYTGCSRNWITHERAEKIVRARIGELLDQTAMTPEIEQLKALGLEDQIDRRRVTLFLTDGITAYASHLIDTFKQAGVKTALTTMERRLKEMHRGQRERDKELADTLDKDLGDVLHNRPTILPTLRKYFILFEEDRVKAANFKLGELKAEYDRQVQAKSYARSDRERASFDAILDRLEADIGEWEGKAVPLDDRLAELRTCLAERTNRIAAIGKAMTGSNHLRKAELVRSLFSSVVLHFRAVKKKVYTDCVLEADKTEFVSNLADNSTCQIDPKITLVMCLLFLENPDVWE